MRESEFLAQFLGLLHAPVAGLDGEEKARMIASMLDESRSSEKPAPVALRIVPFITGRRPTDEIAHPGLGSSDNASMILPDGALGENAVYVIYTLQGIADTSAETRRELGIDVTLSFAGTDASMTTAPIPGWNRRSLTPQVFDTRAKDGVELMPIALDAVDGKRLVLRLDPARDFLPGATWSWEQADPQLRACATDGEDPFTFGGLFTQMLHVHVRVTHRGIPIASDSTWIDVCDTRRFGSLYQRVVERLIKPDTEKQAKAAGFDLSDHAYHPWSPVLLIGSDKAALYTRALIEDIVYKKNNLTDPRWLMRVGLYLELLTCIGIFEAVKDEAGDLLTPAERAAYERHPFFAEIRKRVNPKRWAEIWKLKHISFPAFGAPQTGPVSALNLLKKREAVLGFLHVHHQDLKHAIELAGPNLHNAQETWGRVFRDAERAVLRKTPLAFPELEHLNKQLKGVVLWHQQAKLGFLDLQWMPKHFAEMFGDQDGLFAAACNQYRSSMNEVAEWAKRRGLMEYTGGECVSDAVSILQSYMGGRKHHLERLQGRDGYIDPVEIEASMPNLKRMNDGSEDAHHELELSEDFFAKVPIFKTLSDDERMHLAKTARTIPLGPLERIIIQGREGSSLFVVAEGRLEILVRQAVDDTDQRIAIVEKGQAVGEISLLTGAPRTATVRAMEGAIVYEIGRDQFEPIIFMRPELADELAEIMEKHLQSSLEFKQAYEAQLKAKNMSRGIRRFFLGDTRG